MEIKATVVIATGNETVVYFEMKLLFISVDQVGGPVHCPKHQQGFRNEFECP